MISENSLLKKSEVVILGDGYIANHLRAHLEGVGYQPLILSSKVVNYHDQRVLHKYLVNFEFPPVVINCSGFTGRPNIDEAETKKELCWELNVMSPLRVNEVCHRLGVNYIHVSSGCIFEGYQQEWTELDKPNYGLFENHSSFYSKSKHAFEMFSEKYTGRVLRIRMPFANDHSSRNYIQKIRRYDNLIDYQNSKTYIPDLCGVVQTLIEKDRGTWTSREVYNVVNPNPFYTQDVCSIMNVGGFGNKNWKFVPIRDLETVAGRSNCILSSEKVNKIFPMKSEKEALLEIFESWKQN